MKAKRVTTQEISDAFILVSNAQIFLTKAKIRLTERKDTFNTLTVRASKEVLAQFMREGNIFND